MKKIFLFLLLLCSLSVQSFSQNAEYKAAVQAMFEASGSDATFKAALSQMMSMLRGQYSSVDAAIWDELEAEFMKSSMMDLLDEMVPVYQRHMGLEDLKAITEFYKTPAGKKLAEKTPLITQESMKVGEKWGQGVAEKVLARLQEKGY